MTELSAPPCAHCGYALEAGACTHCGGAVHSGPGGTRIEPSRGLAPVAFLQGFAQVFAAGVELMTRKEFFGTLRPAVFANLFGFALLAGVWILFVHPLFVTAAETDWAVLRWLRWPTNWSNTTVATALTVTSAVLIVPALLQTITAPFVDPIASAVEQNMGGEAMQPSYRPGASRLGLNLGSSAQVLTMQVLVLVPCLALSFCGLGLVLALLAGAFLNALLWFEAPFQRRGYSFDERLRVARLNWARSLGFGMAFQLGMFVPLFNVFLLAPAAVAAISGIYLRMEKTPVAGAVSAQ